MFLLNTNVLLNNKYRMNINQTNQLLYLAIVFTHSSKFRPGLLVVSVRRVRIIF